MARYGCPKLKQLLYYYGVDKINVTKRRPCSKFSIRLQKKLNFMCSKEGKQADLLLQPSKNLMQKHRENERIRHQNLNELIKKLCSQIPGDEEYSKGTKVVTMHRAICYIVYLEKLITNVCKELNLDDSNIFLTSKLSHEDITKSLWGQNGNDFETVTNPYRKFPTLTKSSLQKFTRKNPTKISSKKILNITHNPVTPLKDNLFSEVEHFPGMYFSKDESYSQDPVMCYIDNDSPESGTCNSLYDNSSGLQTFDINDVMDSRQTMCEKINKYKVNVETAEELQCVPSDEVTPVRFTNFHFNAPVRQELKNNTKHKMIPEISIKGENVSPSKPCLKRPLREVVDNKDDDRFESCWKFHERTKKKRQTLDDFDHIGEKEEKVMERDVQLKPPPKVDRRRASWMNGFMMYSQLNRRSFINLYPGVPTSHISKMMGHVWRNMSPDQQLPYKEKAKRCSQYMQNALMLTLPNDYSVSDQTPEDKEEMLTTANIPNDVHEEFIIKLE